MTLDTDFKFSKRKQSAANEKSVFEMTLTSKNAKAFSENKHSHIGPVVSASHLATGEMPALSEIEFAVTMIANAYSRWMTRCMSVCGLETLTHLDILILHSINHRNKSKRLADICLVLNIEDTHTVSYALKKLEAIGLVTCERKRKEKIATITKSGEKICKDYREVREALLVEPMKALGLDQKELSRIAATLRLVSGNYDQAARAAAAM